MIQLTGERVTKFILLTMVCLTDILIGHYVALGRADFWLLLYIGLFLLFSNIVVARWILRLRIDFGERLGSARSIRSSMLPDALRLGDLLDALDEEDADELRAEIRDTLHARLARLRADETESFDDLLTEAGGKRKR